MSEFSPRIHGTEMEYLAVVQEQAGSPFAQINAATAKEVVASIPKDIELVGKMLTNGASYYVDLSLYPEYATPESDSFMDTVTREIAGEQIVYSGLRALKDKGDIHDFKLSKRVVDDANLTWGYHTSFCSPSSQMLINREHLAPLGLHIATQNLFAGAGMIELIEGRTAAYRIAQKVVNLNTDFSMYSHQGKQPLISLRNETLAGKAWTRVHVTSMDANMSPWATWMRLGTTSIVLRLIEAGYRGKDMMPRSDMMHVLAKHVSNDVNLERQFRLADGRRINPIDIQKEFLVQADKLAAELPAEERAVLKEWERAIDDLEKDPDLLADRADWVAKKKVIEAFMGRHSVSINSPDVLQIDKRWSVIGNEKAAIGERLRQTRWAEWMPDDVAIQDAITTPPRTTRAYPRTKLIREIIKHRVVYSSNVGWDSIWTPTYTVDLEDPYSTTYVKKKHKPEDEAQQGQYPY